jgi:hypothetical protein
MFTITKETLKVAHANGFNMLGESFYGAKKVIRVTGGQILKKAN